MKNVIIILMLSTISLTTFMFGTTEEKANGAEYQVIPDEAIRLRILADNNDEQAQALKREVRDRVNAEITTWVESLTSIEAARALIQERMDEIDAIVEETVEQSGLEQSYTVDYDTSVKFPTKLYGTYVYPAGEYEAILITLGEGEGDNWWCVLFPPLCFLDFSNGATVSAEEEGEQETEVKEESEEKEVEFFLVKLFNKLIS
ncbi:stage II sporulation protein R [Halobacillus sp. A1]|uniref:stage II sporulation protein R n=1 Tax=Halobacillus sp. A1 TaxID=2880262 RepID=UPI0020A65ABD|nr:stage II sporulation protein R [Halobacillus sp. A1]MCP3033211.1 stage II sporulation protein R [Halobacillus sp. A1]